MSGTLCLTFDNMGAARDIAEGRASRPDPNEPGLAIGYPRLLGLLDELELRGTFFIEGWNGLHHPERVQELAARGHEVGLHGWAHEKFGSLDKARAEQLLYDGTASLERIGLRPKGFRAPGGLRGKHTVPVLQALGFRYDSSTDAEDRSTQPALLGNTPVIPHARAGKLKIIAQSTARRSASLPEVPTYEESGLKGMVLDQWLGLLVPAGTPREVIERFNASAAKALKDPAVRDKLAAQGLEVVAHSVGEFERQYRGDYEKFGKLIRELKITLN